MCMCMYVCMYVNGTTTAVFLSLILHEIMKNIKGNIFIYVLKLYSIVTSCFSESIHDG